MIRYLFFTILFLFGISSNCQDFTYEFSIDSSTADNSKDVLNNFDRNIDSYNRTINGFLFSFSSSSSLNYSYFDSISNFYGYILLSFNKLNIESVHINQLKTNFGGNDCEQASIICSNDDFSGSTSGYGTQELSGSNNGCLNGNEHESSWYYINVSTAGYLTMTIDPVASDDYDFAIWGPFTLVSASSNCPPISNPIRCSYAATTGNSGLVDLASNQASEGAFGDGWVEQLTANAGDVYIMLIDNYSASGSGYSVTWGGSASLGCDPIVLPIELLKFEGYENGETNVIYWTTISETNNDYFTLEKSEDGIYWEELDKIKGAGNSSSTIRYEYVDENPLISYTYYRLKQTDYDGEYKYSDIIFVQNLANVFYTYVKNPGDGYIYFSSNQDFFVFNTIGKIIMSGNDNKIKIDNLPSGLYVIRIGNYSEKIFIK